MAEDFSPGLLTDNCDDPDRLAWFGSLGCVWGGLFALGVLQRIGGCADVVMLVKLHVG